MKKWLLDKKNIQFGKKKWEANFVVKQTSFDCAWRSPFSHVTKSAAKSISPKPVIETSKWKYYRKFFINNPVDFLSVTGIMNPQQCIEILYSFSPQKPLTWRKQSFRTTWLCSTKSKKLRPPIITNLLKSITYTRKLIYLTPIWKIWLV